MSENESKTEPSRTADVDAMEDVVGLLRTLLQANTLLLATKLSDEQRGFSERVRAAGETALRKLRPLVQAGEPSPPKARRDSKPPTNKNILGEPRGLERRRQSVMTMVRQASTLPAPPPRKRLAEPKSAAEEPRDGRRILLVEDNAVNIRVGVVMVEKRGYVVDVAHNGFEALEAVTHKPYDAVLMDCHMPKFDGFSATAHIRQREGSGGGRRVPIIAMTADSGPGARDKCMAAGMDDYLTKPMMATELDRVLNRWAPLPEGAARPEPVGRSQRPVKRDSKAPGKRDSKAPAKSESKAPPRKEPAVDLATLERLRVVQGDGDGDLVAEVIALFLGEIPGRAAALRESLSSNDGASLSRIAHTLKGTAGHLGAKALVEVTGKLETLARHGVDSGTAAELVRAIERELELVKEELLILQKRGSA